MLHPWDERYHALVAKNMMTDPFAPKLYSEAILDYDFKNWTANKIWLHKQPFPLWTMAWSMKMFGVGTFTLRLPSILLSTMSIFLTFWIGRFLSNSERVGLIAAFLLSINGLVIELASGRVSTVFPLYLMINFKAKKNSKLVSEMLLMGMVTLLVALPWQIYASSTFPFTYQWEQEYNTLHLTESLEGHGQPWWYFVDRIRITINELIYLIFGWFVYQMIKEKTFRRSHLFLMAWVVIPFVIFSLAATKMQGYLLFTFPAWFIITGMFVEHLLTVSSSSEVAKKIYWLVIGATFILAIRYGLERVKPFADQTEERLLKKQLTKTRHPTNTVIFNEAHPIEWMFYNDGVAYPGRPEDSVVDSLRGEGWIVH